MFGFTAPFLTHLWPYLELNSTWGKMKRDTLLNVWITARIVVTLCRVVNMFVFICRTACVHEHACTSLCLWVNWCACWVNEWISGWLCIADWGPDVWAVLFRVTDLQTRQKHEIMVWFPRSYCTCGQRKHWLRAKLAWCCCTITASGYLLYWSCSDAYWLYHALGGYLGYGWQEITSTRKI